MYKQYNKQEVYFYKKIKRMISIDDSVYGAVAERLLAAIGNSEFYNGTVEYDGEGFCSELRTTLIVYREPLLDPADPSQAARRITDIVPVWWEYHLHGPSGERATDFSWRELKRRLL